MIANMFFLGVTMLRPIIQNIPKETWRKAQYLIIAQINILGTHFYETYFQQGFSNYKHMQKMSNQKAWACSKAREWLLL